MYSESEFAAKVTQRRQESFAGYKRSQLLSCGRSEQTRGLRTLKNKDCRAVTWKF